MNIITAICDRRLFRSFLAPHNGALRSWRNWKVVLCLLYGMPVGQHYKELIMKITGRNIQSFKADGVGFSEALFLVGRRGGKSRISSVVGAYEACLSGKEDLLAPGEQGLVVIIAPTKKQCRIIKNYIRAIFDAPLLEDEIIRETQEGFELSNGITIEVLVSDFRAVRGFTLLAAIVDECCFLGLDVESKVRNDTELITALRPALATVKGRLICISTKYAKKGWAYRTWRKNFGNNSANILVIDADSVTMNPGLPQEIIDKAYEEDPVAARSEWGGQWREDISQWLPPETIESCVVKGRKSLIGRSNIHYYFFADVSGGRQEDSALAIGHKDKNKKSILDRLFIYKAPNSPATCIQDMCAQIKRYSGSRVIADNYSANFVSDGFKSNGIGFEKCSLSKSKLYLELIAHICSGNVELLDDPVLIKQLCLLERKVRSGGKDIVDHPQKGKDDCANAAAGVLVMMNEAMKKRAGVWLVNTDLHGEMRGARTLSSMY